MPGDARNLGQGPSPRVRGSHDGPGVRLGRIGSIRACAGEPESKCVKRARSGVHPRVCGGAPGGQCGGAGQRGPSPRVRGSLAGGNGYLAFSRSIPACAGEPRPRRGRPRSPRVHPRVCGGASNLPTYAGASRGHPRVCGGAGLLGLPWRPPEGPSPRVRGSLVAVEVLAVLAGSIPACAGEPNGQSLNRP